MRVFLYLLSFLLVACSPYQVRQVSVDAALIPEQFHGEREELEDSAREMHSRWWEEFGSSDLTSLVEEALSENLSLQAAWERLAQAQAAATIAGSEQYPAINVGAGGSRARIDSGIAVSQSGVQPLGVRYQNDFFTRTGLSWEIDIWKRVASQRAAADKRSEASVRELQETALVLTSSVAELWFTVLEQKALLSLLEQQIETSSTFLELINLRFSVGGSNALAVLQQRQQLASIRSEQPLARERYEVALNQLGTLLGRPSRKGLEDTLMGSLPELPPVPALVSPAKLLETRPDLVAAKERVGAAEYDIASAVADRFPRLGISLNYNFSTVDIADLFLTKIGSFGGDVALPLVDGGRRRAEVDRLNARSLELLYLFQNDYLTALQEVENALSQERNRKVRLERVREQLLQSRKTLSESQSRYVNGLTSYLDVITAIEAVQVLERREISERRSLLLARAGLYRAVGGGLFYESLEQSGLPKVEAVKLGEEVHEENK